MTFRRVASSTKGGPTAAAGRTGPARAKLLAAASGDMNPAQQSSRCKLGESGSDQAPAHCAGPIGPAPDDLERGGII
jgi:hypothetical protein